eukprot:CAMPEP_0194026162 /NCGR_PEP_ID=MMETSP0009_2-20130614/475_1 /TAXON_ID=210454 /ORGANISM="Grammatophora oceanica, Strain CCMP 410" /LENGTH=683 /DNA_ID=CAMNT_0038664711 /DNA_START=119 /DNA_END=2170 /DNA_ORIENTATION=-
MTSTQLRGAAIRLIRRSSSQSRPTTRSLLPVFNSGSIRSFTAAPEQLEEFQQKGYVDDIGLTMFDTLHELQHRSCAVYDANPIFGTHTVPEGSTEGKFEWMTYGEFNDKVAHARGVLKDIGIKEFDKVGIISNNRWEWAAITSAAHSMNATIVPMYEAQLPSDWTYILNDSGCAALFCATQEIFDCVQADVLPSTPLVQATLCLNAKLGEEHAFATAMDRASADSPIVAPTQEDLADLIYTSGTTGKPKGVELTHLNLTSNVKSAIRTMTEHPSDLMSQQDTSLAFLPWAHSYGQTCELWAGMSNGIGMGVCRGVPSILEDLQLVKPTLLFAVPTLYKRVYDGVHNLMESASPIRKGLMKRALDMGRRNADAQQGLRAPLGTWEGMQFKALDSIVLSKIRDRFGGNLRHGFVAGAACPAEVLDFMDDLGIPICEGYGLTETSPIITINTPQTRQVGSVGKAIGGVEVFIIGQDGKEVEQGQEGEICCVGPNVMRSYYKNKEATDKVITTAPDGKSRMFHTGDLGRVDAEGFVKVTGRVKEQYKLENGKYVVPTPIEEAVGMSRFIMQVVLVGANRPHNVALLVPDWAVIRTELKVGDDVSEEDLANDERVKQLIDAEIETNCYKLKKFEIPTKWAFVAPFTAANNMLTPKMSIRRHKVMEAYADVVNDLYTDEKEQSRKEQAA